jgi:uncharacterized membrane protein YphA (DoxX/SURF4 family)
MSADRLHQAAPVMAEMDAKSALLYALQAGLGLVWIAAAVGKARTPLAERTQTVRTLAGGPAWAITAVARGLPAAELAIGLMLIANWQTPVVASVSAVLFFAFAFLVGRAAVLDSLRDGGCGCFGVRKRSAPTAQVIGPQIVARNFVLANLALIVATSGGCACSW